MEDSFSKLGNGGINLEVNEQVMLKLHTLLYTEGSQLFADSTENLLNSLDILHIYSRLWRLKVNASKTRIMIFSKNCKSRKEEFNHNGASIEVVNEFKYLGIVFNNNGRFVCAMKFINVSAVFDFNGESH